MYCNNEIEPHDQRDNKKKEKLHQLYKEFYDHAIAAMNKNKLRQVQNLDSKLSKQNVE